MRRLSAFLRAPASTKALVVEALVLFLAARLLVAHVPMRHWRRRLETRIQAGDPLPEGDPRGDTARQVARAVRAAARNAPFAAVCLPQAMAAQWMLRRRSIPGRLVFGVRRRTDGGGLQYHAWLIVDGHCLVGGGEIKTYAPLPPIDAVGGRA